VKALLLVHLSSLDNYAEFSHDVTQRYDKAWHLAERLAKAIRTFQGPVYIVDQTWSLLANPSSEPRRWLLAEIQEAEARGQKVSWIEFDEQLEDWEVFLPNLLERLKRDGISEVRMGGVWHDPTLEYGCVTYTWLYLKHHLKATVDRKLVGCETDYGKRGPAGSMYRK
jgi:hypothetical protein